MSPPSTMPPNLVWIRRDLRLDDNPALAAALARGGPVIAVFIWDAEMAALGAAPAWRLGQGLAAFDQALRARASRLILRRGPPGPVLQALAAETGARAIDWNRAWSPEAKARDAAVKDDLRAAGLEPTSHSANLLVEPHRLISQSGGGYRVFTPFWQALARQAIAPPIADPTPESLPAPRAWPASDALADWALGAAMQRGAAVLARHARIGAAAAQARLAEFLVQGLSRYGDDRDRMDRPEACSGLSENLAWGEISPRRIWAETRAVIGDVPLVAPKGGAGGPQTAIASGGATFLKELAWRDFAWHLLHHFPDLPQRNWRAEWDGFAWRGPSADLLAWQQGRTGEPMVDAAMRELYVTGRMHNRARMLVASYLTKHLLTDWRLGLAWFADCLTDWDPASNAMGWQWVAGCGPDAAPFFRIFSPPRQAERFDPEARYRRRWIAEGQARPDPLALEYFQAVPRAWGLRPQAAYPPPLVDLAKGRARALAAYEMLRSGA